MAPASTARPITVGPTLLAARLAANNKTADIGVSNEGIGGNRVLRDGTGASAVARFDRDVLSASRREVADAAGRHQRHWPRRYRSRRNT